jgi:crotonobetainyl-CoA:carnitine CoA-transferase CaiB-like acyl-CoA transferase
MSDIMSGVRILEVAEHTFVPIAAAVLADWGAEVIKIEHVERGDAMRGLGSTGVIDLGGDVNILWENSNRGKKSLGLDLTSDEGLEVLYKLAGTCDVFLTNKLPGVRQRLRISLEEIRRANPNIIYATGSSHGERGPEIDRGGYDGLTFWARSGSAMGGMPADATALPFQPAPAYGDSMGGMTIAGGIMGALFHRERTGEATTVDVSLMSVGVWAMGAAIALSLQTGLPWRPPPAGTPTRNPLVYNYPTQDGKFLALSCLQGFHYWPDACRVLGHPELVTDERFTSHESLQANAGQARDLLAEIIAAAPLADWIATFQDFSGQWGPAQDTLEIAADVQVGANGYLSETISTSGTAFRMAAPPVQFGGVPATTARAPEFNEQCDEILAAVDITEEALIDLKIKGVVA